MADRNCRAGHFDLACNRGAQFYVFDGKGLAELVTDSGFYSGHGASPVVLVKLGEIPSRAARRETT